MTDSEHQESLIHQLSGKDRGDEAASPLDLNTWRALKKALKNGLSDRGMVVDDCGTYLMTRFMLEHIETSGLRVVPVTPNSRMHLAIKQALDPGKCLSTRRVRQHTKQGWRYQAAIDAVPSWRCGYELDQKAQDEEPEVEEPER